MLLTPELRDFPKDYVEKTLTIFRERKLKSIVEIGTMRMAMNHPINELHIDCCMDFHSTIYWCNETDDFLTVDINPLAINNAISEVKRHLGKDISKKAVVADGVEILRNHNKPIDLLFLDFCDADLPESPQLHLNAYEVAKEKLHKDSLILIDDTDCEVISGQLHFCNSGNKGKGELLIPAAERDGWHVQFSGRQTLLSRY